MRNPAPSPKAARERTRRSRQRKRQGVVSYRLDVREHEIIEALIESGRLADYTSDPDEVSTLRISTPSMRPCGLSQKMRKEIPRQSKFQNFW